MNISRDGAKKMISSKTPRGLWKTIYARARKPIYVSKKGMVGLGFTSSMLTSVISLTR